MTCSMTALDEAPVRPFGEAKVGVRAIAGILLAACTPDQAGQGLGLNEKTAAKLARNIGTFRYYVAAPVVTKNQFHFLWSPSCRDSMRFYRYALRPALLRIKPEMDTHFAFTLIPRTPRDLSVAAVLLAYSKPDYMRLTFAHLELGSSQDRYLSVDDTRKIIESFGMTKEAGSDFDSGMATDLAAAVNVYVRKKVPSVGTPVMVLNGRFVADEEARTFLNTLI